MTTKKTGSGKMENGGRRKTRARGNKRVTEVTAGKITPHHLHPPPHPPPKLHSVCTVREDLNAQVISAQITPVSIYSV